MSCDLFLVVAPVTLQFGIFHCQFWDNIVYGRLLTWKYRCSFKNIETHYVGPGKLSSNDQLPYFARFSSLKLDCTCNFQNMVVQSNLVIRNFLVTLKLFFNAKCSLSLCKLLNWLQANGSLTPISTLSNRSLSPSLTV